MLIPRAHLDGIRVGRVQLAFRRWAQPRVLVGTRMRTAIGLVEVTSVDEVTLDAISSSEVRLSGAGSREDLEAALAPHPERPIFRIGLRYVGPDPRVALREQAQLSGEERRKLIQRLERLDRASRHGPWTRATLSAIDGRPATRAAELAGSLGRETPSFKRDVRKLKELGLTESLEAGYRLSPRGRALIESL